MPGVTSHGQLVDDGLFPPKRRTGKLKAWGKEAEGRY